MQPSTLTRTTTPAAYRKPHPIRGVLWGLVMGLGATVVAIVLKVIPLDAVWVVLVMAVAVLLGVLWSILGPPTQPKGDPPWRHDEVVRRPDWDAAAAPEAPRRWRAGPTTPTESMPPTGPIPPSGPISPDVEPLHIQPLDLDPLDLDPPTPTTPTPVVPADTVDAAPEAASETTPARAFDPPRLIEDPPPRSDDPPPRSLPPPRPG